MNEKLRLSSPNRNSEEPNFSTGLDMRGWAGQLNVLGSGDFGRREGRVARVPSGSVPNAKAMVGRDG
jgi:hypothetical protein